MSESSHSDDPSNRSADSEAAARRSERTEREELPVPVATVEETPVPVPAMDETAVELVRDAIGVARGEFSDERFSEKYGIVPQGDPDPE
ncbi:hypothetical protein [Halorubrum vacuolatum]|nr:hypothetical protein [Halorubrum vacuolatum]